MYNERISVDRFCRICSFDEGLARVIGVREAILFNVIRILERIPIRAKDLKARLPFFNSQTIVRLLKNMKEIGIIDYYKNDLAQYTIVINREFDLGG